MAGITIVTISASVLSAATAVDKTATGFIVGERATLGVTSGSTFAWSLARPADSSSNADLSSETAAAPTFYLEVAGYYIVRCLVDGSTEYLLRISVTEPATATVRNAVNYQPVLDAAVPTPTAGVTVYYSSDQSALVYKDAAGDLFAIDVTAIP